MSSVSGSGSSNRQDEVVRKNREDYENKESELVKKHHKEVRRISEQHYEEIERLKSDHAQQMRELQDASRKAITNRDQRHQGDIDSLRQLHRNQLKTSSEEAQRREAQYSGSAKNELDQSRIQNDARFRQLTEEYNSARNELERKYQENLDLNREAQKQGMADQRSKLDEAHQRELKFLREDRDSKIGELRREYDSFRKITTNEKKNQQIASVQNQQRASDSLLRAVGRERAARHQSEEILRDGFEAGLEKQRERYDKALAEHRESGESSRSFMESAVRDRVDNRITRLEEENMDLKDAQVREQLQMKNKKEREVSNVRDAMTKNIENLQFQRDEAIRQSNEKSRKDIDNVNRRNSQLMVDSNRDYLQRLEDKDFMYRSDRDQLENDLTSRATQAKNLADQRVKGIQMDADMQVQRIAEKSADQRTLQQRSHADEIRDLKFKFEAEKRTAIEAIKVQAQKNEVDHQAKIADLKAKHEREILAMKDEMILLKQDHAETVKRTVAELQRAHELSLNQQETRHKDRLAALEVDHTNQLKTVNRRNDEKIGQMSAAINKNKA